MSYRLPVKLSIGFVFIVSYLACVPVEQRNEVPFDVRLSSSSVRSVYALQVSQQKDSLLSYIGDEDPSIRYAVARALASFQDSTALDALLPLLKDPDSRVRAMAAEAIGLMGSSRAEADLTNAFDGTDSARLFMHANSAILEATGRIGSAQFLRALSTISNYQYSDTLLLLGQVRGIYRFALREMTDPTGTATMVKYFSDKGMPFNTRLIAGNYLHRAAKIDLTPHAQQLIAGWHSENHPFLRMCLATALGKIQNVEAKKLLAASLQTESDYRVKCSIIRALQKYSYDEVADIILEYAKVSDPAIADVAAQFFVVAGKEKDALKYKSSITQCKTWQAKTKMAEAANKYMAPMFTPAKTSLQNDINVNLQNATNIYEKAAWLKAWGSEIRNFESLPKYTGAEQSVIIRTQAVQSLIDACKDKNFDAYFAGEGHLIRSQIGGYLANAMRSGDAGILALIAGGITDPKTGLKSVMSDRKSELSKALGNLKLPEEMETYIELSKALKEYGIESPSVKAQDKGLKLINWTILDKLQLTSSATIITSAGTIQLELYPERAPASVINFIELSEQNFYNDKAFHRVVPNFVIQSGCPRGDGFGSLDFTIRSELAGAYYDDEGYVGMASAGLHTEGTQFFITHSPAPHLDGRYTIFGKVVSGMDVVHRIGIGDKITDINISY